MKIEIRQEVSADFFDVYGLNITAFEKDTEVRLVELLRNSSAFTPALSFIAIAEGKIVGHILFTKIKIKNRKGMKNDSLTLLKWNMLVKRNI